MRPFYALLLVLSLFTASCSLCTYRNDCPGYNNPAFFHWFPYSPGQKLIFKNTLGATDTITIKTLDTNAAYSFKSKSANISCTTYVHIASKEYYSGTMNKLSLGEENGLQFSMNLFNSSVYTQQAVGPTGVSSYINHWSDSLVTNLTLQGVLFDTVQVLRNTDTSAGKGIVSQIYLAPRRGIVAYELFSGNERWLLQ